MGFLCNCSSSSPLDAMPPSTHRLPTPSHSAKRRRLASPYFSHASRTRAASSGLELSLSASSEQHDNISVKEKGLVEKEVKLDEKELKLDSEKKTLQEEKKALQDKEDAIASELRIVRRSDQQNLIRPLEEDLQRITRRCIEKHRELEAKQRELEAKQQEINVVQNRLNALVLQGVEVQKQGVEVQKQQTSVRNIAEYAARVKANEANTANAPRTFSKSKRLSDFAESLRRSSLEVIGEGLSLIHI